MKDVALDMSSDIQNTMGKGIIEILELKLLSAESFAKALEFQWRMGMISKDDLNSLLLQIYSLIYTSVGVISSASVTTLPDGEMFGFQSSVDGSGTIIMECWNDTVQAYYDQDVVFFANKSFITMNTYVYDFTNQTASTWVTQPSNSWSIPYEIWISYCISSTSANSLTTDAVITADLDISFISLKLKEYISILQMPAFIIVYYFETDFILGASDSSIVEALNNYYVENSAFVNLTVIKNNFTKLSTIYDIVYDTSYLTQTDATGEAFFTWNQYRVAIHKFILQGGQEWFIIQLIDKNYIDNLISNNNNLIFATIASVTLIICVVVSLCSLSIVRKFQRLKVDCDNIAKFNFTLVKALKGSTVSKKWYQSLFEIYEFSAMEESFRLMVAEFKDKISFNSRNGTLINTMQ